MEPPEHHYGSCWRGRRSNADAAADPPEDADAEPRLCGFGGGFGSCLAGGRGRERRGEGEGDSASAEASDDDDSSSVRHWPLPVASSPSSSDEGPRDVRTHHPHGPPFRTRDSDLEALGGYVDGGRSQVRFSDQVFGPPPPATEGGGPKTTTASGGGGRPPRRNWKFLKANVALLAVVASVGAVVRRATGGSDPKAAGTTRRELNRLDMGEPARGIMDGAAGPEAPGLHQTQLRYLQEMQPLQQRQGPLDWSKVPAHLRGFLVEELQAQMQQQQTQNEQGQQAPMEPRAPIQPQAQGEQQLAQMQPSQILKQAQMEQEAQIDRMRQAQEEQYAQSQLLQQLAAEFIQRQQEAPDDDVSGWVTNEDPDAAPPAAAGAGTARPGSDDEVSGWITNEDPDAAPPAGAAAGEALRQGPGDAGDDDASGLLTA